MAPILIRSSKCLRENHENETHTKRNKYFIESMFISNRFDSQKQKSFVLPILVAIYGIVIFNSAWICDDAYITLRTVDNFVNGYGLTWNVAERVQTFTNPLWTLLLSALNFVTHEAYYTTILSSIIISLFTVWFSIYKLGNKNIYSALIVAATLCCSKAFVDYSTSGLENPLIHLFIVMFYWVFFYFDNNFKKLFWLCFFASISVFNRIDTALLFAPALIWFFLSLRGKLGKRKILYSLTGLLPFILWELFAIIYYGFPFPNTAIAKLNTGVPTMELVLQGLYYFMDSLKRDPTTLITITATFIIVFTARDKKSIIAFAGVILYLIYVLLIGGDFMSGRFFAAPFCLSAVILASRVQILLTKKKAVSLFVLIIVTALINPISPVRADRTYQEIQITENGIADERGWYYQRTGLLVSSELKNRPGSTHSKIINLGLNYKRESHEYPVRVVGNAGYIGYYSGPKVYLIDVLGLSDPFLARLKPDLDSGWRFGLPQKTGWRIGHFFRHLPKGYFETKLLKKNMIQNPVYANQYEKIELIIRGEIFSLQRFSEIWKFNTGKYTGGFDNTAQQEETIERQNETGSKTQ